jgi:hypothetical protein
MKRPDKIGEYKVEVFNGERSAPYTSDAYWDGVNWKIADVPPQCQWHHNVLVLSFTEKPKSETLCGQEKIF